MLGIGECRTASVSCGHSDLASYSQKADIINVHRQQKSASIAIVIYKAQAKGCVLE